MLLRIKQAPFIACLHVGRCLLLTRESCIFSPGVLILFFYFVVSSFYLQWKSHILKAEFLVHMEYLSLTLPYIYVHIHFLILRKKNKSRNNLWTYIIYQNLDFNLHSLLQNGPKQPLISQFHTPHLTCETFSCKAMLNALSVLRSLPCKYRPYLWAYKGHHSSLGYHHRGCLLCIT